MKTLLKVLVIGMSSNRGGVEAVIMNYYRNIDRNKIQFDFLAYERLVEFEDEIKLLGGKIFLIPNRREHPIEHYLQSKMFFKKNSHEYRAIWCNQCTLSNIMPLQMAKKHHIPRRMIHSHNSLNMGNRLTNLLHGINKRRVPKLATDYWACSEKAGQFFYGDSIRTSSRYQVIHNAIELDQFEYSTEKRSEIREEFRAKNKFVIGHVGRFHFQKNHEFLIQVFNKIKEKDPSCELWLIGDGEDYLKSCNQVQTMQLEDSVKFLGVRKDVNELMQAMDLFLLPSRFEGLPVVLIEAQTSGLFCMVSDEVSLDAKVTDNVIFLSLSQTADFWAEEVLKVKSSMITSQRRSMLEVIQQKGYSITDQAIMFERFLRVDSEEEQ